jgi:hypothetical protein
VHFQACVQHWRRSVPWVPPPAAARLLGRPRTRLIDRLVSEASDPCTIPGRGTDPCIVTRSRASPPFPQRCRPCRRWQRASSPKALLCRHALLLQGGDHSGTSCGSRPGVVAPCVAPIDRPDVHEGPSSSLWRRPSTICCAFVCRGAVRRRSSPPRAAAGSELLKLSTHAFFDAPAKLVGRRRGTGTPPRSSQPTGGCSQAAP